MAMSNLSAALHATLDGVMSDLVDKIAADGLKSLRASLDSAGLSEATGYEIGAHISGDSIIFEIVVDSSKIATTDLRTEVAASIGISAARRKQMESITRSFELKANDIRRVNARRPTTDARKPATDARKPAMDARRRVLDARKGYEDRRIENPRGMRMARDGALAVTLERSMTTGKFGVKFPKDEFQGIMKDFMDRLHAIISNSFSPELESILAKYLP